MIYSRKFGRSFKYRAELMRYESRCRQTSPIFSWLGLRDSVYSDAYRKEHGLPTRSERREQWRKTTPVVWIVAGILWFLVVVGMCSKG